MTIVTRIMAKCFKAKAGQVPIHLTVLLAPGIS